MTAIHETAYPRLRSNWTDKLLTEIFIPQKEEIQFAKSCTRQPLAFVSVLIQLKVFQYLGRFIPFNQISRPIIDHIVKFLNVDTELTTSIFHQPRDLKSRYIKSIRKFMGVTPPNETKNSLQEIALQAAQTKHHLPDIINVILEQLVRLKIELPAFSFLRRIAQNSRQQVNKGCYEAIYSNLSTEVACKLEKLLETAVDKPASDWDTLKQDAKKPTPHNIKEFVAHLQTLQAWCFLLPSIETLPTAKRSYFALEAQSMDSSMLKSIPVEKRYALMTIYIRKKSAQTLDDVAGILIRSMRKLHNLANEALGSFKVSQTTQVESLIIQLKKIATAYLQEKTQEKKFKAIDVLLANRSEQIIKECDAQLAYTNNNYFPFILKPYQNKRSILFDCLNLLHLNSTTRDINLELAINFIKHHRYTKKRELVLPQKSEPGYFSINWIPKPWLKWVVIPEANNKKNKAIRVSKQYFEICIFSQLSLELNSGDLFVPGSDHFSDYREQLISWEEYEAQTGEYVSMMNLQSDPKAFTATLFERLKNKSKQVDEKFPENNFVEFKRGKLVLKKRERPKEPEGFKQLDKMLIERMPETNILDILVETEAWLNLSQDFRPVSGVSSRIENPRERFIMTLFCYGFNFGPTQTIRMVKGFSRRQIAWLNLRHVTEEKLDKAITKTINHYNNFMLPKQWGTGKSASADGTKWDIYEQNLLSEYHIRYGGYGGIGYYHVSDTYIALFSHFIPCGVYEALYILDGLLKNESDIQPNQVHGDTHAQSYTVFGLAYLLGIELMPRIRNIKELNFYKPDAKIIYKHIESLFDKPISWALIEKYLPDMLRIALSIKSGKLTASAILRKLGTKSRKNKLYFAFRELGRVIRTEFLLRYIDDIEVRTMIHAATCKSEEFNQFLKWTFCGGEGIISENNRYEQLKIIKYNHLVGNLIILHNVHGMTRAFNELTNEGYVIDPELLKLFAPYRTGHINRFGTHFLNLDKIVEPLVEERDFKLDVVKSKK
jgi:TnpA family transposase